MTRLKKILHSYTGSKAVKHTGAGDNVNHPSHYTQGKIECIDAIEIIIQNLKGIEAYSLGNHVKYIWRESLKNGDEDIAKADWYWQDYLKHRRARKQNQS
jgi:hypothetical protein